MTPLTNLPIIKWHPFGPQKDLNSILRGELKFFGVPYVAIAILVESFEITGEGARKTGQRGVTTKADMEFIKWQRAVESPGPFETMTIEGRPYVVFLRPRTS